MKGKKREISTMPSQGPKNLERLLCAFKAVYEAGESIREPDRSFYELVAVKDGSAVHLLDGVESPLQTGSVFLISPGQKHSYEVITRFSLLSFRFELESIQVFLDDFSRMNGFRQLFGSCPGERKMLFVDGPTLAQLDQLSAKIIDEQSTARPGFQIALRLLLVETILLFSRQAREITPEKETDSDKFEPVLSYMKENFQYDIKLSDLAEIMGMSITHFRRLFKNRMGESPIQYLLMLRLAKAKELLMTTSLSVTDIAMKAGFNDANYFSRQFTALTGLPPRVWRSGDHGSIHSISDFDRK